MELRDKIARLVEGYEPNHDLAHLTAEEIADRILALPEIREALDKLDKRESFDPA